ncbi:MAG: class I SAM-dependent methyltransferase [Vulcanimicrobiaceae bacterium]
MKLLPASALIRTGEVDHADWNYRGLLGFVSRQRFGLITALLPVGRVGRLLEIGYGSGIFMPELADRCVELAGIDVHDFAPQVAEQLRTSGVIADLHKAGAERLPFESNSVDVAVAVSSFEFIPDLAAACREISRVLHPGGRLIVVTPGHGPVLDAALRLFAGTNAKSEFGDRRARIIPTLLREFRLDATRAFPPLFGSVLPVYTALRLAPPR